MTNAQILELYAQENGCLVKNESDLSSLEDWLLTKLLECPQYSSHFDVEEYYNE